MLSSHERVRLAAEAVCDPRTVERIYSGRRCAENTLIRVRKAAEALGLPPPPVERTPEVA